LASSHASTVQATPSPQLGGVPATQPCSGLQTSVPLQNRPSLHELLFGVKVHLSFDSSQRSVVHAVPSLQSGGGSVLQP
jgi:hypothetical protein